MCRPVEDSHYVNNSTEIIGGIKVIFFWRNDYMPEKIDMGWTEKRDVYASRRISSRLNIHRYPALLRSRNGANMWRCQIMQ